ncbi:N-6 DNA methylase [Corynebacterium variabile]|uniref:N-6 DNA methylase n=1 Tax=Corynebacterium variabile TaxID=1727 RepID=UPI0028A10148|nr:N-6 DNA methylase [Corynebacterium variabile]
MSTPITATTIAKIAGVTVTAVGQWRRRDKTFPKPLDPPTRPVTFDQEEVLAWLEATGRTVKAADSQDKPEITISQVIDRLRAAAPSNEYAWILTMFAVQRYLDEAAEAQPVTLEPLASELKRMLDDDKLHDAYTLTAGFSATEILEYLDSASRIDVDHGSPQIVNDLLTALSPDSCTSIIDITCGAGGTLGTLHRRFPDAELAGNDVDKSALAMAQARALISGWDARWFQGNALAPQALPAGTFDLVCAVPPWGMGFDKELLEEEPQRWPYGTPYRTDDTAWLQLAHHLLGDEGTAIVVLPVGVTFRSSSRSVLRSMTTDRSLQAVIELPGKLHYGTPIPTVAVVLTKNQTTRTDNVLFARIDDAHVTRETRDQVTGLDLSHIVSALTAHRAGEQLAASPSLAQVDRLDLVDDDKTYAPTYWIDRANTANPDELRRELDTVASRVTPLSGIGDLLDPLVITSSQPETTTASDLSSIKSVRVGRGADKDKALQCGDICVSNRRATVCTVDGERPDRGYIQVFRCEPEDTDPWFLAAVFTAALAAGTATEGAGIQRLSLRLVDVPILGLEKQRRLGTIYRKTVDKQREVELQAEAWDQMSTQLASAIASGLATSSQDE